MDKISPIKERILSFIDCLGIKKVDFFAATGMQSSNFKGVNLKSAPGGDMLVKILTAYPQLSAEWLMRGKGDMMTKSTETINIKVMGPNEPQPDPYKTTQFHSDNQMSEVISVLSAQIVAKDETIRNLREELERVRPASGDRCQGGGENSFNQVLPESGDSDARYAGMVSDGHQWEEAVPIAAEP